MNMNPKIFHREAAEERAEEERNNQRRHEAAKADRDKCGCPRSPGYSVGFAKKLKGRP